MVNKIQNKKKGFAKKFKTNSGFTLIELLVVISIISFLASLILVSVNGARLKARDSQRTTNVSQMQTALDLYYNDHNAYPSGTYYSGWDSGSYSGSDAKCWCESTSTNGSLEQALVMGDYISKLPEDPLPAEGDGNYLSDAQGKGYVYVSDGQNYVIGTYLESTNIAPPSNNATSSCSAAGNYQVSEGSLNPSSCPVAYAPSGGTTPQASGPPVITSLYPSSGPNTRTGPSNTIVTVIGSGFTPTNNTVQFTTGTAGAWSNLSSPDGTTLQFTDSWNYSCPQPTCQVDGGTCTRVTCQQPAPPGPGSYPVTVSNANGTSNTETFTVTSP